MSLSNLHDLYVEQLKDMYSAEKQLTKALPKMAQAASSSELKQAFQHHLQRTEQHMDTVNGLLRELDANPGNKVCKGMEGLVEEGNEVIKERGNSDAKDAALIVAAQKVEHYEIASYGSLVAFAKTLKQKDAAAQLQKLLDDEYEADQKLDNIAEGTHRRAGMNVAAKS